MYGRTFSISLAESKLYRDRAGTVLASVGDPIGHLVSKQGFAFTAPADNRRPVLMSDQGRLFLRFANDATLVSDDASTTWSWAQDEPLTIGFVARFPETSQLAPIATTVDGTSSTGKTGFLLAYDNRAGVRYSTYVMWVGQNGRRAITPFQSGYKPGEWASVVFRSDVNSSTILGRIDGQTASGAREYHNADADAPINGLTPTRTLHLAPELDALGAPIFDLHEFIMYRGHWTDQEKRRFFVKSSSHPNSEPYRRFRIEPKPLVTHPVADATYYAFPRGVVAPDGKVTFVYRDGTNHFDNGSLSVLKMTDAGEIAAHYQNVIVNPDETDYREAALGTTIDGKLILAAKQYDGSSHVGLPTDIYTSDDNGATWTEIATFASNEFGDYKWNFPWGHIHTLADGTLLMYVYQEQLNAVVYEGTILQSTDNGVTWTVRSTAGVGITEATIAPVGNSKWVLISRVGSGVSTMQYAISTDDCETWGPLANVQSVQSISLTNVSGLSPEFVWWGGRLWCAFAQRASPSGIKLAQWDLQNDVIANVTNLYTEWLYEATNSDMGYPTCVPVGDKLHALWYDEGDASAQGLYYALLDLHEAPESAQLSKLDWQAYGLGSAYEQRIKESERK